jgi:hypothetical protein
MGTLGRLFFFLIGGEICISPLFFAWNNMGKRIAKGYRTLFIYDERNTNFNSVIL